MPLDTLQFIGAIAPSLAPALLISWVLIRVILEFLKERREQQESFRLERKEWRDAYEKALEEARAALVEARNARMMDIGNYHKLLVDVTALGRDLVNQMHALKNEITKFLLERGRRGGGNE